MMLHPYLATAMAKAIEHDRLRAAQRVAAIRRTWPRESAPVPSSTPRAVHLPSARVRVP